MSPLVWFLVALVLWTSSGCDARFDSLLPKSSVPDGSEPDSGQDGGGELDGGTEPDGGTDAGQPDGGDVLLGSGVWMGQRSYNASGGVGVFALAGGGREVRFDEAFTVSGVPGPVVVISTRSSLSGGISPGMGDRNLGALESNSGAQTYAIPSGAPEPAYLWVYCLPFTVEVARAELEAP